MNKKNLIIASVSVVLLVIVFGIIKNRSVKWQDVSDRQEVLQELQAVKSQYDEANPQDYNSREAGELWLKAKAAFDKKDYTGAKILLDRAAGLMSGSGALLLTPLPSSGVSPISSSAVTLSPTFTPSPKVSLTPFPETENPCVRASATDKAWCNEMNNWLNKKLVEWKPEIQKSMMFTVVDWSLQSALAKSGNSNLDDLFLGAISDLGTDAVYFSIFPQAYDAYKARYDRAAEKIKSGGKKFIMSYNVGGSSENDPTFSSMPTVDQYIQKENQYIDYYMAYEPDYFLVVVEPYTVSNRVKAKWTAADWKKIIQETSMHVKSINSKTKIGAIMTIADFNVFDAIKNLGTLDIIGFNIYGNRRATEEYKDSVCAGDCVGAKLDEVGRLGKEPWILETWSGSAGEATFDKDWRSEIDGKWLKVMEYYAQKHGAKNMMPFFTAKFISKGNVFDFNGIERALENKERTEAFYIFKDVIKEAR